MPETLFEKLWARHRICTLDDGDDLVAIDRVFLHERTGSGPGVLHHGPYYLHTGRARG